MKAYGPSPSEGTIVLGAIVEAVVTCPDLAAAAAFNSAAFGLEVLERGDAQLVMGVPGSPGGRLRLVERAADPTPPPKLWDVGPRLLGIYSRDLDRTVAAVEAAGGRALPIASYPYGDVTMREVVVSDPDGLYWTIPEVGGKHRPSPALDADGSRLHGELHSAVLVPSDHDAALALFTAGGLAVAFDGEFSGEPFVSMTGMPAGASLRLSFLTAADEAPARFELMSFRGAPGRDRSADGHGLRGVVFACEDATATREKLLGNGARVAADGTLAGPNGLQIRLLDKPGGRA
jgi:catechol 2,3-dioxygenase-like lactoylglutathione lyase family enzyme